MNLERALKFFLKKFAKYQNFYDDDEDLHLSYETDVIGTFYQNIKNKKSNFEYIFDVIERFIEDDNIDLEEDTSKYIEINKIEIVYLSRQKKLKTRKRDFVFTSDDGAIIPVLYFADHDKYQLNLQEVNKIEKRIREIVLFLGKITVTQPEFEQYMEKLIKPQKNTVFAVYKKKNNTDFLKLYAKNYFLYLLYGNKTILSDSVDNIYKMDKNLANLVNLSTADYLQFFEIYDVIDEYHHATDVLSKYLKIYQMIEYLITRTILVSIQEKSSVQNLFLRHMTSLSGYDDFDEKNFKKVFATNEADLKLWFKTLLGNQKTLDAVNKLTRKTINPTSDDNALYGVLRKLIYQLRNSIVHNKASEIHLTVHNTELDKDVIPVINALIKKFEKIILKKIVDFEDTISYKKEVLELY